MTTPEPLIGKGINLGENLQDVYLKMDVKSAVEFYKKYNKTYHKLKKEQPEIFKVWKCILDGGRLEGYTYQDWLFDYCFGDVIE